MLDDEYMNIIYYLCEKMRILFGGVFAKMVNLCVGGGSQNGQQTVIPHANFTRRGVCKNDQLTRDRGVESNCLHIQCNRKLKVSDLFLKPIDPFLKISEHYYFEKVLNIAHFLKSSYRF